MHLFLLPYLFLQNPNEWEKKKTNVNEKLKLHKQKQKGNTKPQEPRKQNLKNEKQKAKAYQFFKLTKTHQNSNDWIKKRRTRISISIKPLYKLIFFCFFVCSSKSNWKYKDYLVGYERSREDIKETECSAPLAHEPFSFLLLIKMIKLRGSNWAVTHWPSC